MRIAQVCPYDFLRPGGVQTHIRGLSAELRRRGHQVEVLAPRGRPGDEPGLRTIGRCRPLSFSATCIDLGLAGWRELRWLSCQRYDLVHYHTFWNPLIPLQVRAVLPAPSVATFHDTPPSGLFGSLAEKVLMPLAAGLIGRFLVQAVVAVSPVTQRYLGQAPVIPNGIEWGEAPPPAQGSEVLYVGRLEPRKGVSVLLRAFERVRQLVPGARLTVAGDGPLRASLERQAGPQVQFLGEVDEAVRRSLLARCALVCAPSLYGESFGLVLLESMAASRPVVAAANEGYASLLTGELGGLLVPPGDQDAMTERLVELLSNRDRARYLGELGRERASSYAWPRVVDRLEALYSRVSGSGQVTAFAAQSDQ